MTSKKERSARALVVGNGSIFRSGNSNYVNKHIVRFLSDISDGFSVSYMGFVETLDLTGGLQDTAVPESIAIVGPSVSNAPSLLGRVLAYVRYVWVAFDAIRCSDVVYIFVPGHSSKIAIVLSLLLRKKYGLYIRGFGFNESVLAKTAVRRARFVLSVSESFDEYARSLNGKTFIIYPMIDIDDTGRRAELFEGQAGEKFTVLFVGRVSRDKGVLELEQVIDEYTSDESISFKVVGGGAEYDRLAEKYEDARNVDILGQVSDKEELERHLSSAHMFVFPSKFKKEGFPRVLYEAMLKRLPVATTMVGAVSDLMKPENNCVKLEVGDSSSIKSAIERIRSSRDLAECLVCNATSTMEAVRAREKHAVLVKRIFGEIL